VVWEAQDQFGIFVVIIVVELSLQILKSWIMEIACTKKGSLEIVERAFCVRHKGLDQVSGFILAPITFGPSS
jgi:hypothetical protein